MKPLIVLEGVGMTRNDRQVLSDVNLTINRGDFVAVTGPNGGGKTTLLKLILKLLHPSEGKVIYLDDDGKAVDRLTVGYLPQKTAIDSRFPIDVRQVIASGLIATKRIDKARRAELVEDTIDLVGLRSHASQPIGRLSGGQVQRALLGRALIADAPVLVLDEPLSYVDKHFERHIYDIIGRLAPERTIVLVSHEISKIAEMANRHIIVDRTIHDCHSAHHFARVTCED